MPEGKPQALPVLPFADALATPLAEIVDLHGGVVLRGAVSAVQLQAFTARLPAGGRPLDADRLSRRNPGHALTDILPAPQTYQLLQSLLGDDYVLVDACLGSGAHGPMPPGADAVELRLPLRPVAKGPAADLILLRGPAATAMPPDALMIFYRFAPRHPPSPRLSAELLPRLRVIAGLIAPHDATGPDDAGTPAGKGAEIAIAQARLMQDFRPGEVLPLLRGVLEDDGLLPAGTARWAMPEYDPPPESPSLPASAGHGFGLVLAVRNQAELLQRALDGLAAQERPFDQIVLVDDASEDASLNVLQRFAADDGRVEVMSNPIRLGGVASAALALRQLRTGYVSWASADDLLLPHALARLAAAAEEYPAAALALGETGVAERTGGRIGPVGRMASGGAEMGSLAPFLAPHDLPRMLCCRPLSFGTAWAMRRDALLAAGGFEPDLGPLADFYAALALSFRHGVAVVPERLSSMSVSATSYSRRAGRDVAAATASRDAVMERLKGPGGRDVYWWLSATPALIGDMQSGAELFSTYFALRPCHWDLMLRALHWGLRHGTLSVAKGP
ncbi:glycosyltransferase family 2 protein [Marinibaculum pumilum]|uniref:Glycosyltransferase family 2 protein n=1 Tax=Marinibaculum pumilum TaxID=1766165 RepID=A0ABV7KW56_9PROT